MFLRRAQYHYHVPPVCLLDQLESMRARSQPSDALAIDVSLQASPQIAWAIDGFPVYGPKGLGGVGMYRCGLPGAHPLFCLDECNGCNIYKY